MKSLTVQGPWAAYEHTRLANEARIRELEAALDQWKVACQERDVVITQQAKIVGEYRTTSIPALQNQIVAATETVEKLQQEQEQYHAELQQAKEDSAAAVAAYQAKLDAIAADNALLKAELAKTVQTKQAAHSKVEEARKKLGFTTSEAEFFIKDLDQTKAANASLKAEVSRLTADKARLEQQCDSRAQHAMTLIADNRRLLEQVAELRQQVSAYDQDMWQLKQDLAAAKKVTARAQQRRQELVAANKARPEWQASRSNTSQKSVAQDISNRPTLIAALSGVAKSKGVADTHSRRSQGAVSRGAATSTKLIISSTNCHNVQLEIDDQGKEASYHNASTDSSDDHEDCENHQDNSVVSQSHEPLGQQKHQHAVQAMPRSCNRSKSEQKRMSMPQATVIAVREAAEQLDAIRVSAMQQALAARQQRLAAKNMS